jgi:prepilin-type N-terminal cleavage/methylation domain-containing protein
MQVIRRGFTIVELLIATFIFLIGFVSVYGLFLRAVQFRREGENMVRCSLAASSIVATMRLKIRAMDTDDFIAKLNAGDFIEDGDPTTTPDPEKHFFAYLDQPGMFYRISEASPLMTNKTNVAKFTVQTVFLGSPGTQLSEEEVKKRCGNPPSIDDLVTSGAITQRIAIIAPR